jgi:hypothetical protein
LQDALAAYIPSLFEISASNIFQVLESPSFWLSAACLSVANPVSTMQLSFMAGSKSVSHVCISFFPYISLILETG